MESNRIRYFSNDDYKMVFNTKTGFEVLTGINGKDDPFSLVLPSLLDAGVMGHCKNKCKFCYQDHISQPNMKLEDFKRVLDEISYHTNQVALGGRGDPNHHENFKEILEYSRFKNVVPNYTTSGINLTNREINLSKMCGAVAVSAYDKPYTYQALKKLMNANIKTNIHFIYSSESHDKAINIIKGKYTWEGNVDIRRLNAIIFLLFKPQGAGRNLNWTPTNDQLKEFAENIFVPKCQFKVGMDSCLVNHVLKYIKPSKIQEISIDTCEAARCSAYITPDMKLLPCSFENHNLGVPITEKMGIHEIWESSPIFIKYRHELKTYKNICPAEL